MVDPFLNGLIVAKILNCLLAAVRCATHLYYVGAQLPTDIYQHRYELVVEFSPVLGQDSSNISCCLG